MSLIDSLVKLAGQGASQVGHTVGIATHPVMQTLNSLYNDFQNHPASQPQSNLRQFLYGIPSTPTPNVGLGINGNRGLTFGNPMGTPVQQHLLSPYYQNVDDAMKNGVTPTWSPDQSKPLPFNTRTNVRVTPATKDPRYINKPKVI